MEGCHQDLRHMEIEKTYELVSQNYYWPGMYKDVRVIVTSCVTCQARRKKNEGVPLMEMEVLSYYFEKISMDVSGPCTKMPRGNVYIVSFVDWLTNWVKAYAVMNKTAQTTAQHILVCF